MEGSKSEVVTLGGGCFWCLEAVFERLIGVRKVVSGYSGGMTQHPTYGDVCEGDTGHAEVVQIVFDPDAISYENLLEVFFAIHDPTTLNRQGNDHGTQYRSVIFYHSEAQRNAAITVLHRLVSEDTWSAPVVTELRSAMPFYAAEDYHQHYYSQNAATGYCQLVVAPKVAKLRNTFKHLIARNHDTDRA